MLEKLFFAKEQFKLRGIENIKSDVFSVPDSINGSADFQIAFQNHLSHKLLSNVVLENTERGRLGITYKVEFPETNQWLFCKTHRRGARFNNNIEKEYYFLKKANRDFYVDLDYYEYNNEYVFAYMLQEWLDNIPSLSPQMALSLIRNYSSMIDDSDDMFSGTIYTLQNVVEVAKEELAFLTEMGEISAIFAKELLHNIEALEPNIQNMNTIVCHGDFGDKNVMVSAKGIPVIIDWEDSFRGVEGYDYLYWLTFFNHRKFYKEETFKASGLSCIDAKGILTIIMIIKF